MENTVRSKGDFVDVPSELLEKACVKTYQEGLEALKIHNIGFPLMVRTLFLYVFYLPLFRSKLRKEAAAKESESARKLKTSKACSTRSLLKFQVRQYF